MSQLLQTSDVLRVLKLVRRCGTGGGALSVSLHADMWSMVDNIAATYRLSRQDVIRAALVVFMDLMCANPTNAPKPSPEPVA